MTLGQRIGARTLFINPNPDDIPEITTLQIADKFAQLIGLNLEYSQDSVKQTMERRRKLIDLLPRSVDELPPRKMKDSFVNAVIPLARNPEIRERYLTFFGTVRIGRILEDLDIFAVWSCYKHLLNPKANGHATNPYSVVTALVDSIHFSGDPIRNNEDIRLSSHVSWTGRSSMEVSVLMDQKDESGRWKKLTDAVFLMVARDPMNTGPAIVNPLVGDTEEERNFILLGEERNKQRRNNQKIEKLPDEEERDIIHNLFLQSFDMDASYIGFKKPKELPSNLRFMNECKLNTLLLCHPQYRNRFNKIFGGFIMRQAFELAFANVFMYTKERPTVLDIDDILFKKPVEIGSLLRFNATIGYVEGRYVHIPIIAEVIKPETGERDVTNVFHFTFLSPNDAPPLVPNTYQEAMLYLDSRRHFKEMMSQNKL